MMSHFRWLIIPLFVYLLIFNNQSHVQAQEPIVFFERLSLEQGLSHNTVFSIVQDKNGFLWFGTQSGLNKYDGHSITVFRHEPNNSDSISSDNAGNLFVDRAGIIWIGTWGGGLNRFDPNTGQAITYLPDPDDPNSLTSDRVQSIFEDRAGNLWVGTAGDGLNRFNREAETFTHYRHDPDNPNSISHDRIWRMAEDEGGYLWIATSEGLNRFDPQTETFTRFFHQPDRSSSLSHSLIRTVYIDSANQLWVGTEEGLNRLDLNEGLELAPDQVDFIRYKHDSINPNSLGDDIINAILEDRVGNLWVGTSRGGLDKFDRQQQAFYTYTNDLRNPNSLSYNDIRWIHEDESGVLWLATRGGGVNKFIPTLENFTHWTNDPINPNSLNNNDVRSIYMDHDNNLWMGTRGGGLNKYSSRTQLFTHYKHNPDEPNSLSSDDVYAIHEDRNNQLWLGMSGGGLMKLDPSDKTFIHYPYDPDNPAGLSSTDINSIYEDDFGRLWIGTKGGGLNLFDPMTEEFIRYQHQDDDPTTLGNDDVYAISAAPADTLWISTYGGGLNKLTLTPEAHASPEQVQPLIRYQYDPAIPTSLSNNDVYTLYPDKQGQLWVGTANGGLNQFDPATQQFSRFTQNDGLLSDVIYGILADEQERLWLSTSKGLSRFDPQTQQVINYDTTDGLPSMGYNEGAYYKSSDGRLFFGGINGVLSFDPDEIATMTKPSPVVLTNLIVSNRTIPLPYPSTIELAYGDNVLSFEFAVLDYVNPSKNQYAYKLDGFDDDWVEAGNRRFATYTNLDPGIYTFQVRGANSAGIWNETGTSISLTVAPPFWETWWFTMAMILAGGGVLYAGYKLRVRGIKAQSRKLEGLVAERAAELLQANERLQTLTDHLQGELVLAQQIQRSLLPLARPDWPNLDFTCYSNPVYQVGGDFYAYHALSGNLLIDGESATRSVALAVGDVSGKGLPAALLMAVSLASLQSVIDHAFPPNELLAHLDEVLVPYTRTTRQNCALCYIELHHHTLHVVNAGCIAPVIKRNDGTIEWVEVGGVPLGLGLGADTGYNVASLELTEGDLIILTSDGVLEAFNAAGEMFGFDRLETSIVTGPTTSSVAMLEHLITEINTFVGETEPHDDLTMVVIRV